MKWEQAQINGKPQPEGIQSECGNYRIGRFNGTQYGYQRLGYFADSAAAKGACESHLLSLSRKDAGDGRTRQAVSALPDAVGAGES